MPCLLQDATHVVMMRMYRYPVEITDGPVATFRSVIKHLMLTWHRLLMRPKHLINDFIPNVSRNTKIVSVARVRPVSFHDALTSPMMAFDRSSQTNYEAYSDCRFSVSF